MVPSSVHKNTLPIVKARTKQTTGPVVGKVGWLWPASSCWPLRSAGDDFMHLTSLPLVKAGLGFPDGEGEMFQSEPGPDDPLRHTPSMVAACAVSIQNT